MAGEGRRSLPACARRGSPGERATLPADRPDCQAAKAAILLEIGLVRELPGRRKVGDSGLVLAG